MNNVIIDKNLMVKYCPSNFFKISQVDKPELLNLKPTPNSHVLSSYPSYSELKPKYHLTQTIYKPKPTPKDLYLFIASLQYQYRYYTNSTAPTLIKPEELDFDNYRYWANDNINLQPHLNLFIDDRIIPHSKNYRMIPDNTLLAWGINDPPVELKYTYKCSVETEAVGLEGIYIEDINVKVLKLI